MPLPPIQLIDPDGSFVTAPHLRAWCDRLAAEGTPLEIATRLPVSDTECPPGAVLVPFPPTVPGAARSLRQWLGRVRLWLAQNRRCGGRRLAPRPGTLVAAVNPEGLLFSARHVRRTAAPVIYFANEIIFRDEARTARQRRFKEHERAASRLARLVIASDPRRGALLREENGLSPDLLFDLPVAPGGRARQRSSPRGRGLPGIPPECLTILHAGSLRDWTGAPELAAAAPRWPDHVRLVLHHPHGTLDPALRAVLEPLLRTQRVVLDCTRLGSADFDHYLDAFDFGLVTYRATYRDPFHGKNIAEIGLASGKFSVSARAGLPVLAVDQPVYLDLNRRYGFGGTFATPDEIPALARSLVARAAECSSGIARLFDECLSFDRWWPELRARMAALNHS